MLKLESQETPIILTCSILPIGIASLPPSVKAHPPRLSSLPTNLYLSFTLYLLAQLRGVLNNDYHRCRK